MAKTAKKPRLLFKPTPISRLSRYTVPFPMVGDPKWNHHASGKTAWESREKAVYAAMMETKTWPMAWSPDLWVTAHRDNAILDIHISTKWDYYELAHAANFDRDWLEATRENAAIDYHRENYLEPAI